MSVTGPWTSAEQVKSLCGDLALEEIDQRIEEAIDVASELLFWLSGMPWRGVQTVTVRPHDDSICMGRGPMYDVLDDPLAWTCGCVRRDQVDLGVVPVTEITQVLIDGDTIVPSEYTIVHDRYLQRLAGDAPTYKNPGWPRHQHMDRPTTEPGTFSVTFKYGLAPSAAGQSAAAVLAGELVKAHAKAPDCQLPGRVTSINRQGVSMTLIDPTALAQGKTGVYEADLFLAAVNPKGVRGGALVWSPDLAPAPR